jgi:hypothetical protein
MGDGRTDKITAEKAKPPGKKAADPEPPLLIPTGDTFGSLSGTRLAGNVPWMPVPEAHHPAELASQAALGARRPDALQTTATTDVQRTADAEHYSSRTTTGIGGNHGAIQTSTAIDLSITAEDPHARVMSQELDIPHDVRLYPVQIAYRRELNYMDREGRVLRAEVEVLLGMEHDTWNRQNLVRIGDPSFADLANLRADRATAHVFLDGGNAEAKRYFGYTIIEGDSTSMAEMVPRLRVRVTGVENPLVYDAVPGFVPVAATAGEQFTAIRDDLIRSFDAAHREQAEADAKAAAERNKKHHGPFARAGLAMLGAVAAVAEGLKESVLSIADFQRLFWLRMPGRITGLWDYEPEMWSQAGKAAEQGATSGDIARGMVKNIIETPERWRKAAEADDPYQFGKESMQLYMLGRSGYSAAKGTAGMAFNAGVRQLAKAGSVGWRAAAFIRTQQVRLAYRFGGNLRGMVFPRPGRPRIDYDPVLNHVAQYDPNFHLITVGELAFSPVRGMWPNLPPGNFRMRVGNFLRGNLLGRSVRHEAQHAMQHAFDPMNPAWRTAPPSYFQNPLEFTQPGSVLPGAWNTQLGAPVGPIPRAIGGTVLAPSMIDVGGGGGGPGPAPSLVPQPTDDDHAAARAMMQRAMLITTRAAAEARIDTEPLVAVLDGTGRLLVGEDAIAGGVWFVFGNEEHSYVVPAYVLDQAER